MTRWIVIVEIHTNRDGATPDKVEEWVEDALDFALAAGESTDVTWVGGPYAREDTER